MIGKSVTVAAKRLKRSVLSVIRETFGESKARTVESWMKGAPMMFGADFRESKYGPLLIGNVFDMTYRFALSGKYGTFIPDIFLSLPKDRILIDIGSNIGVFSVVGAQHFTSGRVYAFEPNPVTFKYLQQNLARNGCDNALGFCLAISEDRLSPMTLSFSREHSGAAKLEPDRNENEIRVTVMDHTILDVLYEADRQYVVKIDVEGHEISVLNAVANSRIFQNVSDLIIEVSENTSSTDEIEKLHDFLREAGFELAERSGDVKHADEYYVRRQHRPGAGDSVNGA